MDGLHFFAGGNTKEGFVSRFPHMLPAEQQQRMYYIKGGPGVGKSTLMRRVAEAALQAGEAVEWYHCSSDPDSLDGVSLPARGVAMMDGTAPHVYDPVIPGARDTLVSLGDHLDEAALRPHTKAISELMQAISAYFARCYRYLAAAGEVYAAASVSPLWEKMEDRADAWAKELPLRGGTGSVRQLFASAYTPKGRVDLADTWAITRRITVDVPFGAHATPLMKRLSRLATRRGLPVVELLDPLSPSDIAHVLLPAHGVAFLSAAPSDEVVGERVQADALFAQREDARERFDQNAYELLIECALEQLRNAKALHDELERFYVGNMDFALWQDTLAGILSALSLA